MYRHSVRLYISVSQRLSLEQSFSWDLTSFAFEKYGPVATLKNITITMEWPTMSKNLQVIIKLRCLPARDAHGTNTLMVTILYSKRLNMVTIMSFNEIQLYFPATLMGISMLCL